MASDTPTADTPQTNWSEGLIDLLGQQRAIYRQLYELTGRQAQLVKDGEAEPLLELLARRQSLIDELTQINARVEPYKKSWSSLWPRLDSGSQQRVQSLIDDVQGLLDEIVAQDEKDRAALSARRDEAGAGLRHVRAGSAVNRAYGRPTGHVERNRYTDQQG